WKTYKPCSVATLHSLASWSLSFACATPYPTSIIAPVIAQARKYILTNAARLIFLGMTAFPHVLSESSRFGSISSRYRREHRRYETSPKSSKKFQKSASWITLLTSIRWLWPLGARRHEFGRPGGHIRTGEVPVRPARRWPVQHRERHAGAYRIACP